MKMLGIIDDPDDAINLRTLTSRSEWPIPDAVVDVNVELAPAAGDWSSSFSDGISPTAGATLLLVKQTDSAQNGFYTFTPGASANTGWTLAPHTDAPPESYRKGKAGVIPAGDKHGQQPYMCTGAVVDNSSGALTSATFIVGEKSAAAVASAMSFPIVGDGTSKDFVIPHGVTNPGLFMTQVIEVATGEPVIAEVVIDATNATVTLNPPRALGARYVLSMVPVPMPTFA